MSTFALVDIDAIFCFLVDGFLPCPTLSLCSQRVRSKGYVFAYVIRVLPGAKSISVAFPPKHIYSTTSVRLRLVDFYGYS
jgi:hypothetical protein